MFNIKMKLSNSHVDNNEKMSIKAIINALQDVEGLHIDKSLTFANYVKNNNIGIFLMYRQVDILKLPSFGEEIKVETFPYATNLISGYRHIYIVNKVNERIIKTNSYGAFVKLDDYQPTRLPREIIKSLNDGIKDESFEILPRKIDYDEKNAIFVEEIEIRKSQIDRYNHVNNAHYISFAYDLLDNNFFFNRIRVEYKKSFLLKDKVKIFNEKLNEKQIFIFKNENDEVCSLIEFSQIK